jgi:hypothetical protein
MTLEAAFYDASQAHPAELDEGAIDSLRRESSA